MEWPLEPDLFVLVRAQGEQESTYPPGGSRVSWRIEPYVADYAYVDRKIYAGYTYRYRVYAVKDGQAILSSNAASAYVETGTLY